MAEFLNLTESQLRELDDLAKENFEDMAVTDVPKDIIYVHTKAWPFRVAKIAIHGESAKETLYASLGLEIKVDIY